MKLKSEHPGTRLLVGMPWTLDLLTLYYVNASNLIQGPLSSTSLSFTYVSKGLQRGVVKTEKRQTVFNQ